jgi:hypothetical protein
MSEPGSNPEDEVVVIAMSDLFEFIRGLNAEFLASKRKNRERSFQATVPNVLARMTKTQWRDHVSLLVLEALARLRNQT